MTHPIVKYHEAPILARPVIHASESNRTSLPLREQVLLIRGGVSAEGHCQMQMLWAKHVICHGLDKPVDPRVAPCHGKRLMVANRSRLLDAMHSAPSRAEPVQCAKRVAPKPWLCAAKRWFPAVWPSCHTQMRGVKAVHVSAPGRGQQNSVADQSALWTEIRARLVRMPAHVVALDRRAQGLNRSDSPRTVARGHVRQDHRCGVEFFKPLRASRRAAVLDAGVYRAWPAAAEFGSHLASGLGENTRMVYGVLRTTARLHAGRVARLFPSFSAIRREMFDA